MGQLTMVHYGVNAEKLSIPELSQEIHRNKIEGTTTADQQYMPLSKEKLAGKPFKFMTKCGRHLSIGFNLKTSQLTLKHNGDDVENLPEVEKELRICRNKITKSSTSDQRYVSRPSDS